MPRQSLGSKLESAAVKITSLESELENKDTTHTGVLETLKQEHLAVLAQAEAAFKTEKDTWRADIDGLRSQIAQRDATIDELNDKVNRLELKRFADAFAKQEIQYRGDADKWFANIKTLSILGILATGGVIALTVAVIGPWYSRVGYYLIDLIILTLWVFALRQYSYYVKLSTDYGNRKTLAQSYFNILDSSDDDDEVIQREFLDKISSILAAPAEVELEANTLPEKILEKISDIAEIIKSFKKP